jgi:hypothetical protein
MGNKAAGSYKRTVDGHLGAARFPLQANALETRPMDIERLFSIANTMVLPGWFVLIFLPRWRYSAGFIASVLLPALLGLAYAGLFASEAAKFDGNAFGSLAGIRSLFAVDAFLLAGWIHYLAFDLFVGSWEVRDAQAQGIHHLLVIPCLFFTFMLGPVGLLLYLILRFATRGKWTIETPQHAANVSG